MPRILLYLGVLLSLDLVVEKSSMVSSTGVSDERQVQTELKGGMTSVADPVDDLKAPFFATTEQSVDPVNRYPRHPPPIFATALFDRQTARAPPACAV